MGDGMTGTERRSHEFAQLDERLHLAAMLGMDDPDEAERALAEVMAAGTVEESLRLLDEILARSEAKIS